MIYALWQGGDNGAYAPSDVEKDLEVFDTVEDAAVEAENRYRSGGYYRCDVRPVSSMPYRVLFPGVTTASYMEVWFEDPRGTDTVPDIVITYDERADEFVPEGGLS